MKKTILIFGNGYVTEFLSKELASFGWRVYSTSRQMEYKSHTEYPDITIINFLDPLLPEIIKSAKVILSIVPPNEEILDPVLEKYLDIISKEKFDWIGYLSSTSVYGNHNGQWLSEKTKFFPSNLKSKATLLIEQRWCQPLF